MRTIFYIISHFRNSMVSLHKLKDLRDEKFSKVFFTTLKWSNQQQMSDIIMSIYLGYIHKIIFYYCIVAKLTDNLWNAFVALQQDVPKPFIA